jgi:hypothetical protein
MEEEVLVMAVLALLMGTDRVVAMLVVMVVLVVVAVEVEVLMVCQIHIKAQEDNAQLQWLIIIH